MGCACRKANRAGGRTASGQTVIGYDVTYPAGWNRQPETYLSLVEARAAVRSAGGGTITRKSA